jgi:uncharacterized Zn ribbon protein
MSYQNCKKCGSEVEPEDLGDPCDSYYCDHCGHHWVDTKGWADRMADHADYLRKSRLENG